MDGGPGPRSGAADVVVRGGAGRSELGLRHRHAPVSELVRLVDDVGGDFAQLVSVLTRVVGAEQELATGLELYAKVGLGAATVAAVRSGERWGTGGNGSGHNGLISGSV
jgi:hypothetical protein